MDIHPIKKRNRSSMADKMNNMICADGWLGFGSRVRSIVIDVNVKPLKRDNAFVRIDIY